VAAAGTTAASGEMTPFLDKADSKGRTPRPTTSVAHHSNRTVLRINSHALFRDLGIMTCLPSPPSLTGWLPPSPADRSPATRRRPAPPGGRGRPAPCGATWDFTSPAATTTTWAGTRQGAPTGHVSHKQSLYHKHNSLPHSPWRTIHPPAQQHHSRPHAWWQLWPVQGAPLWPPLPGTLPGRQGLPGSLLHWQEPGSEWAGQQQSAGPLPLRARQRIPPGEVCRWRVLTQRAGGTGPRAACTEVPAAAGGGCLHSPGDLVLGAEAVWGVHRQTRSCTAAKQSMRCMYRWS
jgi:hypothetical protein